MKNKKPLFKKIYPLMSPNKKIIGNKSLILNLVDKKKRLVNLLLKKNSMPKKTYRLNKCFFWKKNPIFVKAIKKDAVFFNFNLKNFYKSLKNEFTPYFIYETIHLKKNKQLVSTTELAIKKNSYNSKKFQTKNFSHIRSPGFIKSKLTHEILASKQYNNNTQQITHTTYYSSNISRLFKQNNLYKKQKKQGLDVYSSYCLEKKNSTLLINNKQFTYVLAKLSQLRRYKTRINPVINKVNVSDFPNAVENILRLKTRIKNQSLTILEKSYELFKQKALEEKKIAILNNQLFDIKRDTETLLKFSKKMLMANKISITKTYVYDFL